MATYNVPLEGGIVETREYRPMYLEIGGKRIKFAIQGDYVCHYASGQRVGNLQSIKVERMARISSYTKTTNRQAAVIAVLRIVEQIGADKFLGVLDAAPVLNH